MNWNKINNAASDIFWWFAALAMIALPCWAVYKFCNAVFFLLNKLIDKI